ncbi:hypothetical protein A4A49_26313 [Nicotiana attenuata]|uniref:Uncharacterized protein n=1 Tax=Nicotiana attenuata TaxID=49451 RepID=A0A1J6KCM1_NICAT|nr:hypothetical protein A4A49_26313 [Nicotiana attenuata]
MAGSSNCSLVISLFIALLFLSSMITSGLAARSLLQELPSGGGGGSRILVDAAVLPVDILGAARVTILDAHADIPQALPALPTLGNSGLPVQVATVKDGHVEVLPVNIPGVAHAAVLSADTP